MRTWYIQICCMDPRDDYAEKVTAETKEEAIGIVKLKLDNSKSIGKIWTSKKG